MKLGNIGEVSVTSDDLSISDNWLIDDLSKMSILSVIAGYLKKNDITISGKLRPLESVDINSLVSYILNNRKFAPMDYKVRIDGIKDEQWTEDSKRTGKMDSETIISFSGGIDSTAAVLYYLDRGRRVIPFFVDFGQKNIEEEKQQVGDVLSRLGLDHIEVKVDLEHYITEGWKEWDYIVPARNFMFVCLASSLLNHDDVNNGTIVLAAHEEEITHKNTDKSRKFYRETTALLRDWYQRDFQVTTPFFRRTKAEVLSYWLRVWQDKYNLSPFDTVSCYYGRGCGRCNTCVKRAISLSVAGYSSESIVSAVKENPFNNAERMMEHFVGSFPTYPDKRKHELLIAIHNNLDFVSEDVRSFYETCSKEIKNKSQAYKQRLEKVVLR